jgi:predicted nucleotidyltransferase component of viral defense system
VTRPTRNIQASIHQRLLNVAAESGRLFNDVVMYYAIERFLYRLSKSAYADRVVLKGGLLLRVWDLPSSRVTRDIDLLGRVAHDRAGIASMVGDVSGVAVDDDGIVYEAGTVKTEGIAEDADYQGVRATFRAAFGKMPLAMQIDFGFSDAVTPSPEPITYPSILDHPPAELMAYNRETVIAEKFEAMVKLGELNTRMKDFFDIYVLASSSDFDGPRLARVIATTLARRGTNVEPDPVCFHEDFAASEAKQKQWRAFLRTTRAELAPEDFVEVVALLAAFLSPVVDSLANGQPRVGRWQPDTRWQE